MINYIKGNLLESDCDIIIHGCNCFCTMGSGIAKSIKEMYPEAFDVDLKTLKGDRNKLGTFSFIKTKNKKFINKDLFIVNAYTQYNYGRKAGEVYADYNAIEKVMSKINNKFADMKYKIGLPKIGAGLAQGDWKRISDIINTVFYNRDVYVYEWNNGEIKNEKYDLDAIRNKWKNSLGDDYHKYCASLSDNALKILKNQWENRVIEKKDASDTIKKMFEKRFGINKNHALLCDVSLNKYRLDALESGTHASIIEEALLFYKCYDEIIKWIEQNFSIKK